MSSLLLAPFNDSMRLGQGYNSFLQTPCLGNAVDISNSSLVDSKGGNAQSQTVSYSARFVEKMSDVVQAMNISAGSSIRTGSVSVSGGGNNIDEIKFAESDLNAVISVKVVNQTRNLRENLSFKEIAVQDMTSDQFHEIYGNTFISGFIEGGDLHGIISIKTIDASKKSEVKNALRSQFNGTQSEWSPSSNAVLGEALRQSEVTVTVNWSGGGIIKPPSEEWTIDSLIRVSSAFADNVAQCPQRTWAILTRYDTVPNFVVWSRGLDTPIVVRRYEGVQRYTSELLDMYIEYKGNLLILNDAIRHQDRYEEAKSDDRIALALKSLIEARKSLRAEMGKIAAKIELLDKSPVSIDSVQREEITEPELWRARLPFRKDIAIEAASTQSLVETLFKGLPIHPELGDKPGLSEQLSEKELQLKLAQSEETKNAILKSLEEANTQITQLTLKLTQAEETKNATSKSLDEAKAEISQLKNKPPEINSFAWWRREGLCPQGQRGIMPRYIREWAARNSDKWSDCRISYHFSGLKPWDKDGSDRFECTLDHIGPEDKYVVKVEVFMRATYICGLKVYYVSKKMVQHGDCTSLIMRCTESLSSEDMGWVIACSSAVNRRPSTLDLVGSDAQKSTIQAADAGSPGSSAQSFAMAPGGYFLRGFWTQYDGDGFQRLGFVWGRNPEITNPSTDFIHRP
ncbi:uncharacterized protein FPRO_07319 [Fusarium proliferatum ET1]|uniref:Uncharacterized protein n=1 Tax=Fusarium proliferatum (strain ET1) TaxID=1227346 RepID=A0A1L7VTM9_FUSPR|nr:uncharacterized protein FPRO_07319 [Fusarium proliferatum ET1]CZR43764.1 uncharacterized protein FPRO_07319 [Fusarium proliferatum ET1]